MKWGSQGWATSRPTRKNKMLSAAIMLVLCTQVTAAGEARFFGVLNQRSAVLTAKYWNPILLYVIKQQPHYGFVAADDRDYQNYLRYFKTSLVRDCDGCPGDQKAESW